MNENQNEKLEYNVQKRAKAGTSATLRAVVALYLLYLGYQLLRSAAAGSGEFPAWAGWTFGMFFLLAGLGFGVYIWKRWRTDVEAARLTPEEQLPADREDGEEEPLD